MSENILKLPVIPLRGLTVLPGTTVHFDISRKSSIKAAETAMLAGKNLFVVTQKNPVEETPGFDGIYNIGTVVVIKQLNKLPDNIVRVMVEAKSKGQILAFNFEEGYFQGKIDLLEEKENNLSEIEEEAFVRELKDTIRDYNDITHELSANALRSLMHISSLKNLMRQLLMRVRVKYQLKQTFLEEDDVVSQFGTIISFLKEENEIALIRTGIIDKVKQRLDKNQREHILREQMQVIREELGDDFMSEAEELEEKIHSLNADKELAQFITEKQKQAADGKVANTDNPEGLVNGTIDTNLGLFRAYMVMYLRRHPFVSKELLLMVRTLPPVANGLPVQIYCFSSNKNWPSYESIQAEIMEHFVSVLPAFELYPFQNADARDMILSSYIESAKVDLSTLIGIPWHTTVTQSNPFDVEKQEAQDSSPKA